MRIPPFQRRNKFIEDRSYDRNGRCDHCSESGARRAAAIIQNAWAQAGHVVHIPVKQVAYGASTIWAPDMSALPNGLPR